MTANQDRKAKTIGNVGTLDLRSATEEAVAAAGRIGNVGLILCSAQTAPLVPRLSIGNAGGVFEVASDARLCTGTMEIDRNSLSDSAGNRNLVVVGQLLVRPDVTAAEIERGLDALHVCGQVLCPRSVASALKAKLKDLIGELRAYDGDARLTVGKLTLDAASLGALDDGSQLMVIGKVEAPAILEDSLLRRKVARLEIIGKLFCRGENLAAFRDLLGDAEAPGISSVPEGFEPVTGSIVLEAATLSSLPGRKLHCRRSLRFGPDLDAETLDRAVEALRVEGLLICPAALKEVVARKCPLLETKAVFYEGELWLIDEPAELPASRFEYLEGRATLVVREPLRISPGVEPRTLADRLHKIHNLDTIVCTAEQMGAIQARLGLNEGRLVDSSREEESEGIGNVGTLKL